MTRKIALISFCTPTFNNAGAASALPYHLILGAKEDGGCAFEVWTFNLNNISVEGIRKAEEALGVKIHLMDKSKWYKWMFRLHLTPLRILLRYPLLAYFKLKKEHIEEIISYEPDTIWIYGEELAGLARNFPGKKRIVTMPDCETLYYHRVLATDFLVRRLSQVLRYSFAYWQYRSMDRWNCTEGVKYHFVGRADTEFYKGINPKANAVFIRHPHYAWKSKEIKFHKPRIRLLFAGRYDIYCQHGSNELLNAMVATEEFKEHFEVTFLGKGWEAWCQKLSDKGWKANHIVFAPDYIEEIQRHDIQINAIDLGTGTKGKVLDALANGLLALGTPYALENIAVENGKSCVQYYNVKEAISELKDIILEPEKYEAIAKEGQKNVLKYHRRDLTSRQLFDC